jgi:hypothetical protein
VFELLDEEACYQATGSAHYPTILKVVFQILHQVMVKADVEDAVRTFREAAI